MIEKVIQDFVKEHFSFLEEDFEFALIKEEYDEQYFEMIYQSEHVRIKIQRYRQELYLQITSTTEPEGWVDFFNIVEYLNHNKAIRVDYNFYPEINDLQIRYEKQIKWLAQVFREYYLSVKPFCDSRNYRENQARLREFLINRYPNFFKRKQ